jgi:RNA polymerase sigma-70 factor, ECF subfamily
MTATTAPGSWMNAQAQLRVVVGGRTLQTEEEMVEGLRHGDRAAEEAFYRAYGPAVLALTTRLLGRRSDAEDAAQDTFVLAFQSIDQLRDAGALRPWVLQIAVSQVRRRFRKHRLLRILGLHVGADDATLESLVASGASAEVRTDLSALDRVLAGLPVDQRLAWMLRYVEGEELAAIATICSCSLATVKRRIASADTQIRGDLCLGEGRRP